MSGRLITIAVVTGIVVGWVVGVATGTYVTMCADGPTGGYCEEQGGPNLLAAVGAALLTTGTVSIAMWVRQRRR